MDQFNEEVGKSKKKIVVITEQVLPISLKQFATLFIEEGAANSYKAYHESVKDTNVNMTSWTEAAPNNFTREIKFLQPVNLPGLASTRGTKLQNYKKFGDYGLVLNSSTHLEDVPAADTFSVNDCLAVSAEDECSVKVEISFAVVFIKSTFLKAMIEGPTNSEMKKWMAAFFENLKKVMHFQFSIIDYHC